jgi:hypothetical protein
LDVAGRQHGVVSAEQLVELGLSGEGIESWRRRRRLHSLFRGVYAVGRAEVTREGRWMAAVLIGGEGAVLSGPAAAAHWGILRWSGRIEVSAPRQLRDRRDVRCRERYLPDDEKTLHDGIPITTVPRTIFDLAATRDKHQLKRAIHESEVRRLWDRLSLLDLLHRYPRARGTKTLRAVLNDPGEGRTRNDFEAAFLEFVERAGLPRPEVNAALQLRNGLWIEPDFLWREQKVIVEHARPTTP